MAKKKGFWNDNNGFTVKDFEKLVTGLLFSLSVIVICFKYAISESVSTEMIYMSGMLGTLFIARKGISYFKPERYYNDTETSEDMRG